MKAVNPLDGKLYYFIDKVVVFGSSKSCRIFSEFGASLAHNAQYLDPEHHLPNEYLDDLLTGGPTIPLCNSSLQVYLDLCAIIKFPISEEKTEWATQIIVLLGLLLNTITGIISIQVEKRDAALTQIDTIL